MNERGRFKAKARARGFVFAFRGLTHVVKTQHNMWIHLAITLAVIVAAVLLRVNKVDWLWLIISVTLVFFAEVINSAFEFLCDVVRPEHHDAVAKAKDIAAGAVLLVALGAAIIGAIVFWPYIFQH